MAHMLPLNTLVHAPQIVLQDGHHSITNLQVRKLRHVEAKQCPQGRSHFDIEGLLVLSTL